jgi:hypothetical protein
MAAVARQTMTSSVSTVISTNLKEGWSGFLRARLKVMAPTDSPVQTAWCYAMLGKRDRALGELERAYDARDFFLTFIKVDPGFEDLRSDARFRNLLRKMSLES